MDNSRKCMSIHAIVDKSDDIPLSPPDSFKSHSPSPTMNYLPSPKEGRRNSFPLPLSENNEIHRLQSPMSTGERKDSFHMPMSIEERRYRNKLASAKYRAKKQANVRSMSAKVSQLMTNNSVLQRELNKVKQENQVLQAMLSSYQSATHFPSSPTIYNNINHVNSNTMSGSRPQYHYNQPYLYSVN